MTLPPALPVRRAPAWVDHALRAALSVPGWLVDKVDGAPRAPDGPTADAMYPKVRDAARHPEAHLALEEGLHYHEHGPYVVAYDVRGATAFGIGGVNAPPEDRQALLASFADAARGLGLKRALLFPLRQDELADAAAAGFHAVQVGVEAWLDLDALGVTGLPGARPLQGSRYAEVRYMTRRAARKGVQVAEVAPGACNDEIAALHAAWLYSKRPSWRMKLLVGSPGLGRPFDRRYLVARADGELVAFITLLPGAPGVWGVDVMCRRPDAPPGAMEALLVHAATALGGEGAHALSLGPCPMAGVPVTRSRPVLTRTFDALYRSSTGNRLFGFRNLHHFKAKFRPRWEPVYVAASPHLGALELYLGCRMWGLY